MSFEIAFIGLGRMGFSMAKRCLESDLKVHVFNRSPKPGIQLKKIGAKNYRSIDSLLKGFSTKRKVVWLMLPAGKVTESYFAKLLSKLKRNDILIDGGNSNFHDSIRRHELCAKKGIKMLDIGVSGGVVAAKRGYAMMAGGDKDSFNFIKPALFAMCQKDGFDLVSSEPGSGHYTKMVHNAIEYGMMQAIGEGFNLLENGRMKKINLKKVSKIWNNGCIVSSFLMEMAGNALDKNSKLNYLEPHVNDSGEGRWSVVEAMEHSVPFNVNTSALMSRYESRDKGAFSHKLVAAMRQEFGGHAVKKTKK